MLTTIVATQYYHLGICNATEKTAYIYLNYKQIINVIVWDTELVGGRKGIKKVSEIFDVWSSNKLNYSSFDLSGISSI